MSETIEQTTELVDRAEINSDGVLVQYTKTEAALADLRKKYHGATFDLTTTKGDKEARAARLELVTLRGMLEKRRKELKKPALEFGQKIDAEAERITTEIKALENPIDAQIVADENRRAAEKAERERIEAERIAGHQTKLAALRGCVARAQGLPSARIAKGIEQVEGIMLGVTVWEEFAAEAATAKQETLAAMRVMFDAAKTREDEDARVEAQRIENERIAAENRAAAERLAEQKRALDAQAAAIKAEQDAIEARNAEELANLQREAIEQQRAREAEEKLKAQAQQLADWQRQRAARLEDERIKREQIEQVQAARIRDEELQRQAQAAIAAAATPARVSPAIPADSGARLTLGQINERLEVVSVNTEQLARMGFTATVNRSARTYLESDFPRMCAVIQRHLIAVTHGVAA